MAHEYNFFDPAISTIDLDLFLGPIEEGDGTFEPIQPGWSMAHIVHAAGCFPSVKQAKNNGWDKPLPVGFGEYTVGKSKLKIFVLTPFPYTGDPTDDTSYRIFCDFIHKHGIGDKPFLATDINTGVEGEYRIAEHANVGDGFMLFNESGSLSSDSDIRDLKPISR